MHSAPTPTPAPCRPRLAWSGRLWLLLALFCLAAAGFAAPRERAGAPKGSDGAVVRAADQGILADGRAAHRLLEQRRLAPDTGLSWVGTTPAALAVAEAGGLAAPVAQPLPLRATERGRAATTVRAHPPRAPPA
jgi:hypothetical protein